MNTKGKYNGAQNIKKIFESNLVSMKCALHVNISVFDELQDLY